MFQLIYYALATLGLQYIVTKTTRTQKFSIRALIRNQSFALSLYLYNTFYSFLTLGSIVGLLTFPLILELLIEFYSAYGYHIDQYIATEYAYSDFFEEVVEKTKMMSNFSEGNYDQILGFDTKDHGQENLMKIDSWLHGTYGESFSLPSVYFNDSNGQILDTAQIKYESENAKFALISEICGIDSESARHLKILEIGFGKTDFMMYLREKFNADVSGVSISNEQVKFARSRGFKAYHMNCWDMRPGDIGKYDVILQCGNIEYLRLAGYSEKEVYTKYGNVIKTLLEPNGKFFVTGLHNNPDFYGLRSLGINDLMNIYLLWKGNDGAYPYGVDGFSEHFQNIGFKKTYCEERTNDYYIYSGLWMSSLANAYTDLCRTGYGMKNLVKALVRTIGAPYYIHTYLCYIPHRIMEKQPWVWQFIPQKKAGRWASPSVLLYMLFEI